MSAAKPVARFTVRPSTPSVTRHGGVLDCSADPEHVGIAWRAWDFGDGVTSVGPAPVHRYGSCRRLRDHPDARDVRRADEPALVSTASGYTRSPAWRR